MQGFRGDGGQPLGVVPTLLVMPPTLEDAARRLLNGENGAGGEANPWKDTAELVMTPYVRAVLAGARVTLATATFDRALPTGAAEAAPSAPA